MLRAAILLIALAVAGAPLAPAACGLWCTTPSAEQHHHAVGCHRMSNGSAAGEWIATAAGECPDTVSASPFLNEARDSALKPTPAATAVSPSFASTLNGGQVAVRVRVFDMSAAIGSLHSVLRL